MINYSKSHAEAEATMQQLVELGGQAALVKADVSQQNEVIEMISKTIKGGL